MERTYVETGTIQDAMSKEPVTFFGRASTVLPKGQLPDGGSGLLVGITVKPHAKSVTTVARMDDAVVFLEQATLEVFVGQKRAVCGPVHMFPAQVASVQVMPDADDNTGWSYAQNGSSVFRMLLSPVPVPSGAEVEVIVTGPTTQLAVDLTVEVGLVFNEASK